jgi:hypothetical protein
MAAGQFLACSAVVFARIVFLYGDGIWNDAHAINFLAAWIPSVVSVLVAFVPDKDLERRVKLRWRLSIILCGFVYSFVVWHQQDLNDRAASKTTGDAVGRAVSQANSHADEKFEGVQKQVTGIGESLDKTQKALSDEVDKSSAALTASIGKVGKPDPPEIPKLRFSLWRDDLRQDTVPLESTSVQADKDGAFEVPFFIMNDSSVVAQNVEIWVQLCDSCSFAKEPEGFDKPEGTVDRVRHRSLGSIAAGAAIRDKNTVLVRVNVPNASSFSIVFKSTCLTCGRIQLTKEFWINTGPILPLASH